MMSLPTGPVRSGNRNHHGAHRRRRGQTMLELVAATTIISLALTPALRLTRSSLMNIDTLEKSELSVSLCVSKLEEQMALTAATWDLTGSAGDYSSIGHPELRFISTISDAESAGGNPGRLAVLDVVVWNDQDGGNDLDADEQRTRMVTKLARVLSYEYAFAKD